MDKNINKKKMNTLNEKRGVSNEKIKNNKFDFKQKRQNTVKSLSEVESFLRNFKKICNYIKLYKIIK